MTTALYLAHLNPVTSAHVEIIRELQSLSDKVTVMPVIFLRGEREVNSRSFPFGFGARRDMLRAVFGDAIEVSRNYTFHSPFSGYLPPCSLGARGGSERAYSRGWTGTISRIQETGRKGGCSGCTG